MQELHNVKGSRKNGIYVDCKQLAIRLYKLSFTMAKRDRVIFGDRMLSLALDCVEDFAFAYQYPERRVEYTERLIFDFGRLKELMRMACVGRIRKADLNRMLCSLNTYCGIFKGHNNRRHLELFKEEGLRRLGKYVKWNESKKCFNLVMNFNEYLISRYAGRKAV